MKQETSFGSGDGPRPASAGNSARTRLTEICDITTPVFQAAMAGLSGPDLVAAVSEAGGLGHLGALRVLPKTLRGWIHRTRDLTDRPFGVNLVPQYGGPEFFNSALKVVLEERPKVLSLFYGDFQDTIPKAQDAGIITMVQVGSLKEAEKAVSDGADIIIAQGIDAGGHIRGRVGLMALLPAVVDIAGDTPVLAAGAINDIRAARAARCLGASGVWCGTAFLASQECDAHDAYKDKLVRAGTDAPKFRTGYSYGWTLGTPHRSLDGDGGWNLLRFMGGGIRRVDNPKMADKLSLYAGQGIGQIKSIRPAADIVHELARAFDAPSTVGDVPSGPGKRDAHGFSDAALHCISQESQVGVDGETLVDKYGADVFAQVRQHRHDGAMPILDQATLTKASKELSAPAPRDAARATSHQRS